MIPWKDIAEITGIGVAVVTLILGLVGMWRTRKIERAKFWLDLRDRLAKFQDIHVALCPDGEWHGWSGCPATNREWRQLEAYMGLIEHCGRMIDDWLLDWETFKHIYGYRIHNIAANPYITQAKLIRGAKGWGTFLGLTEKLEIHVSGTDIPFEDWPRRPLSSPTKMLQVILKEDPTDDARTEDE
jgi:hypothetical protein